MLSRSIGNGGPQGLQLKAWAIIPGPGGVTRGSGGITGAARTVAGTYALTVAAGVLTGTDCILVVRGSTSSLADFNGTGRMTTATAGELRTYAGAVLSDAEFVHLELWQ